MKIFIVEDDQAIANLININLSLEGFETTVFSDAESALKMMEKEKPDLILLDIMLPGISGFEMQSRIRELKIPVIFLTARTSLQDRLLGLELGGDDYITKPFDNRELVLRVKAVLRRVTAKNEREKEITIGPFRLLIHQRFFYVEGRLVELTPTEFELIKLFMKNYQRVFSREELLDLVWGFEYYGDTRTIDMHIQRLRKKLGKHKDSIKTVYGIGYQLNVDK
ncbi:MAG TPA: response regulator transcription factor [Firmicutes bacterium]|nr:response regulator transcription factor [Bacillota bacterium]